MREGERERMREIVCYLQYVGIADHLIVITFFNLFETSIKESSLRTK